MSVDLHFGRNSNKRMFSYCLIIHFFSTGLPVVVVAITMGVNSLDNYRSKTQL